MLTRRNALKLLASGAAMATVPRLAVARLRGENRLVLVVLRGGLDGLAAVPPIGDPNYVSRRGTLALSPGQTLALDGYFALHPSLKVLHSGYQNGELLIVHGVATPYRNRSHFDGQDLLETGAAGPRGANDGWLNRALGALGGDGAAALAVGQSVPLVLRGEVAVANWAPSVLPAPGDVFFQQLGDLYSGDPALSAALAEALRARDMADDIGGQRVGRGAAAFANMAAIAGRMLSEADGPRIAVLEMGGWDTHANQGAATGQLARNLAGLDDGLERLRTALGSHWRSTVVMAVTEFGRTAAANGTAGTDHGTAGIALVVGGAVTGGRVAADWPGLAARDLYEGRDLRPTIDLRSVFKGVLGPHLAMSAAMLDGQVFPDSQSARALVDLTHG